MSNPKTSQTLSNEEKTRRIAILCLNFLRNLAYHRALYPKTDDVPQSMRNIWNTFLNGVLDSAVLEWCKLFTDKKGKHSWKKIFTTEQQTKFKNTLQRECPNLEDTQQKIKQYRDKFVAHLDNERTMNIPELEAAKTAVCKLLEHINSNTQGQSFFTDAERPDIQNPEAYYEACQNEAEMLKETCLFPDDYHLAK